MCGGCCCLEVPGHDDVVIKHQNSKEPQRGKAWTWSASALLLGKLLFGWRESLESFGEHDLSPRRTGRFYLHPSPTTHQ